MSHRRQLALGMAIGAVAVLAGLVPVLVAIVGAWLALVAAIGITLALQALWKRLLQ